MSIVREKFNFSNAAVVFFQMTDQLTATNLPDTDIALHTSTAEKLAIACQFDSCNTVLVCIIYLPKQLAIINSKGTNFTI